MRRRVGFIGVALALLAVCVPLSGAQTADRPPEDATCEVTRVQVRTNDTRTVWRCVSIVPHATPTAAPTTAPTVAPTASVVPTATTVPPTPAPTPAPSGGFVETFDGNTGLDRFRTGVYHRDDTLVAQQTWPGAHDLNCGGADTTRTIHRNAPAESIYVCRDHLMTSVGDTSGYSIAWFSPDQTFDTISEVCWSVNLTDLGARQWWKVAVLSVNAPDIMSDVGASDLSGLEGPDRAVASWGGVGGWGGPGGKLHIGNQVLQSDVLDAGTDQMTRYPACFRDNQNGTLTFTVDGPRRYGIGPLSHTVSGSFPAGPLKVVFMDHNYTPTKSDCCGDLSGGRFTWHFDDIVVVP